MSRRARVLVPAAADVERFDWTTEARPAAAGGAAVVPLASFTARPAAIDAAPARPATPATAPSIGGGTAAAPAAAVAAAPVTEDSMLAEHRERLAALEREAFTKGYAQGERAGLEAGGKRAEAMLRRVA